MYYEFKQFGIEEFTPIVCMVTSIFVGFAYKHFDWTILFRIFVVAKMLFTVPLYSIDYLEEKPPGYEEKQPMVIIRYLCYYMINAADWGIFIIIFIQVPLTFGIKYGTMVLSFVISSRIISLLIVIWAPNLEYKDAEGNFHYENERILALA